MVAKSLQSCLTLCNPIDGLPPGSPIPGILQTRTLEWVAISFSNAWKWKVKVKSLSGVQLSDLMDCSPPGSSVHGIFQARVLEWGAIAFSVVHSLCCVQLFATPWTAGRQASLSSTISWSLLKIMSIESVMLSNHLFLYRPFLLLPSIFPSIRVFSSKVGFHIRGPKYRNFSFSISPFSEYSELISLKIGWSKGLSRVFSSTTV